MWDARERERIDFRLLDQSSWKDKVVITRSGEDSGWSRLFGERQDGQHQQFSFGYLEFTKHPNEISIHRYACVAFMGGSGLEIYSWESSCFP